jgi:tripartite-type tricarboxylate transporter receptor subunit TctC
VSLNFLALAAVLLTAASPAPAQSPGSAADYPDRPVRFYNSGGVANTASRVLAEKLTASLGKAFVVETVAGAGGFLAATKVATSPADGYTIFMAGEGAMTSNVALYKSLPYNPLNDFVHITLAADSMNILVVNPALPVKTLPDLIALAKERPGKLTFASSGFGNSPHLAGELLKSMAAVDVLHVPYRDAGAVLPDLIAGRVDFYFGNTSAMMPLMQEGKVRALAVTGASRNPSVPELPTVAELGFPGYQATTWIGIIAPTGLPKPIVSKLHREFTQALVLPDVKKRFVDMGLNVIGSTPEQFTAQIASDIPKKIKIVTDAGIERR